MCINESFPKHASISCFAGIKILKPTLQELSASEHKITQPCFFIKCMCVGHAGNYWFEGWHVTSMIDGRVQHESAADSTAQHRSWARCARPRLGGKMTRESPVHGHVDAPHGLPPHQVSSKRRDIFGQTADGVNVVSSAQFQCRQIFDKRMRRAEFLNGLDNLVQISGARACAKEGACIPPAIVQGFNVIVILPPARAPVFSQGNELQNRIALDSRQTDEGIQRVCSGGWDLGKLVHRGVVCPKI